MYNYCCMFVQSTCCKTVSVADAVFTPFTIVGNVNKQTCPRGVHMACTTHVLEVYLIARNFRGTKFVICKLFTNKYSRMETLRQSSIPGSSDIELVIKIKAQLHQFNSMVDSTSFIGSLDRRSHTLWKTKAALKKNSCCFCHFHIS